MTLCFVTINRFLDTNYFKVSPNEKRIELAIINLSFRGTNFFYKKSFVQIAMTGWVVWVEWGGVVGWGGVKWVGELNHPKVNLLVPLIA